MKKQSILQLSAVFSAIILFAGACIQNQKPLPIAEAKAVPVRLQTHAEASDTLLKDTLAPRRPLKFRQLQWQELAAYNAKANFTDVFSMTYPDNGFYGDNRYRIEFIFTKVTKSETDPMIYFVEGKNRHKKVVTKFKGTMRINSVRTFYDPNLDAQDLQNMAFGQPYALAGSYEFAEDSAQLATSGLFKGNFQLDYCEKKDSNQIFNELWFYSDDSPAKGSGYRFDGTWTSYVKKDMVKPVIWSRDLFRFANDILENFSYGERDIEINPKYRELGWDNFWDAEEWWNDSYVKQ
jgi:hypothetical protein